MSQWISRYYTKDGICWARNSNVQDIDDTVMGFRLLRMQGYEVTPDVLRQFEKDGTFVCFPGQSTQAVTGMRGRICLRYSMVRQLASTRDKILLGAIWRRG
nr:ent-copalyl diphosphate synthase, chloroplastic-like [Tanacetum cinerariifolium]